MNWSGAVWLWSRNGYMQMNFMTNFWRHLNLHTAVSWPKSITSSSFHQNRGFWQHLMLLKPPKIPYQNRRFLRDFEDNSIIQRVWSMIWSLIMSIDWEAFVLVLEQLMVLQEWPSSMEILHNKTPYCQHAREWMLWYAQSGLGQVGVFHVATRIPQNALIIWEWKPWLKQLLLLG